MARPAKGGITERIGKDGAVAFQIRFRALGRRRYITLGSSAEGWTRAKAEEELRHVLADVERGIWKPPEPEPTEASEEAQTFHVFASRWFEDNKHGWAPRTVKDYEDTLSRHVLPYFKDHLLTEITIETVDRFRSKKLAEGKLAPAQVNKCIKRLSQILEVAEEYELIAKNPARGKKRKAKEPAKQRSWVEPEQSMALLEESSKFMRPVVATLIGSGLRVGEACALEWAAVNLATGTIRVGKAKTDAGSYRELDLPAGLVEELTTWKHRSERLLRLWHRRHRSSPVFLTEYAGEVRSQSEANVSRRLKTSIKRANEKLAAQGIEPISDRVTPHSLRRSYASIRVALGDDLSYIAEQMGHTTPRFTLAVYSKATKRRSKLSGAHLAEFDRALAWATLPTTERVQTGASPSVGDQLAQELSKDLA